MKVSTEVVEYVRAHPRALGVVGLDPEDVPLSEQEIARLIRANATFQDVGPQQVIAALEKAASEKEQ